MNILVAGGTGFIGRDLLPRLVREGHIVTALTRDPAAVRPRVPGEILLEQWDAKTLGPWVAFLGRVDAVINLAGESTGSKPWTTAQRRKIVDSRLDATTALVQAIRGSSRKPSVLVSASAVGYYGDVPEGHVTEDHQPGAGFLADLCVRWEAAAVSAEESGVRVVRLRTGLVLGEKGGALARMVIPFRLFVGGTLGSGRQWIPWVHRQDVVNVIVRILADRSLRGPLNVVSPAPVRMSEFVREIGHALGRPAWTRVPSFVLKAALGEMSSVVLTGQRAVPAGLLSAGFQFDYPTLPAALQSVMK
jgi:hypothetical protein